MTALVKIELNHPELPAAGAAMAEVNLLVIDDQMTYDIANNLLKDVKARWEKVEAQRKEIVDPLMQSHRATQALFNPVLEGYLAAEKAIKSAMLVFVKAEEQKRITAQAAIDKAVREEREKLEAEAKALEAAGKPEEAEAVQAIADVTSAPVVVANFVRPKGNGVAKTWKARVTDKAAMVSFIAQHPEYLNLLDVNEKALNQLAKSMEDRMPIVGVEAFKDSSITSRAA